MRVLVVTNMYPTERRPALGPFVRDQVRALRKIEGLDLELYSFDPPGGLRPYVRAARAVGRRYRGERFDVVHAHYGLTAWCALAVRGAPHVVTFHGDDLRLAKVGRLSGAVARLVDLPAAVSAGLARSQGRRLGGPGRSRRVAVLPCGVDLQRFRPLDRTEARRRLGLDPEGRYLLFPADPARPEKRHDRARELAAAHPEAELLAFRNTPPEQAPLYVNAADAVLVTSEREGFGLAVLEALACDVPVLATAEGIAPLALGGVEGALCAPFERETWSRALAPHLEAADPRIRGRARAAMFSSERMAERVFQAYRELAPEGPGPPI